MLTVVSRCPDSLFGMTNLRLKTAYTTRHVPDAAIAGLMGDPDLVPRPGDLVVATVKRIGEHKRLELRDGRKSALFEGDTILVAYGNRYAPDQFEAVVPTRLEPCDLVAAGGIAARTVTRHASISAATEIAPLGLAVDAAGERLSLSAYHAPEPGTRSRPPLVVAIVGSSMNAGKTTTAAHLVRGLRAAGLRTGAAKITGTGAGGDRWLFEDAGADAVLDFTDAGVASTSLLDPPQIDELCCELVGRLGAMGMQAAVVEVADGLLQPETAALVDGECFRTHADAVLFAAGDAMSAVAGTQWLRDRDLPPTAISGRVSASPLAAREAAAATGLDVLDLQALASADVPTTLSPSVPTSAIGLAA